jgi:hypothetical protein
MDLNQRQFPRQKITEQAIAVNERGLQLGRVKEVGAGGMTIVAANKEALLLMPVGRKMRVNVIEPGTKTTTTMQVEVLYVKDQSVGVKFASIGDEK